MTQDRLRRAFNATLRAGAHPRRADPRFARPVVLTVSQALVFATIAGLIGSALTFAGMDLRGEAPAAVIDLRLATIVRAALPDADALSQDDLVARLTLPPQVGAMLAPLAATDPARVPIAPSRWLGVLQGTPPTVSTPERMRALGEIASALDSLPDSDRTDQIANLIALYVASRNQNVRTVIAVLAELPRYQRDSLAGSLALRPLLAAIADLPEEKRIALANGRLDLLPDAPDRLHLIQSIPTLERPEVSLINRMAGVSDPHLRQAIIFVVDQICSGTPQALALLTAYYDHEPALMAALDTPPSRIGKPRHDQ